MAIIWVYVCVIIYENNIFKYNGRMQIMDIKLSNGQKRAVETKGKNILVSAAAGSGKTFVLTQRVLSRIIDDRWDIDSFLIVTFTRDAAGEMKSRITKSLEEKLAETTDEDLIRHIEKQLILINRADISTIDAFCSRIVRQNFHKTDLDPGYKTPTEVEAADLKKQAMEDALNELLGENDAEFRKFYFSFAGKSNDKTVTDMIDSLYIFADSLPYPGKWFDKCIKDYDADSFEESIWGEVYREKAENEISSAREYAEKAMEYFKYCDRDKLPKAVENVFTSIEEFENAFKKGGLKSISALQIKFRIDLRSLKEEYALAHIDVIKRYLNFAKDSLNNALNYASQVNEKAEQLFQYVKPDIKALVKAARTFAKRYKELKLDKQMAEFNDISHYCLDMLRDDEGNTTEIAKEYQNKFNEIIIDEYQDSNYLQEAILTAVSRCDRGENNIFMVGDVKQAIYRFRQTTPELFIEKYDKYSDENSNDELILLSENYRSRAVVLDACNLIFKQIMDERLGNVRYTDEVALNPKADFPEGAEGINISKSTELIIVDASDKNDSELDPKAAEAKAVAKRIHEMLVTEPLYIYDKEGGYRAVRKSDIVILVNKRTNAGVFFEELNSIGIDCAFEVSNPLFKTTEVKNIISLLRLIDNPLQDIDVINVLHSPMYGLSFDDIAEIRIDNRTDKVYTAVKEYSQKDDRISAVLRKFLYDLSYYRDFAINNSTGDLLSEIYDRSNYFNYTGILDRGDLRRSNLRLFKEIAIDFESKGITDLHSFISYIDTDLSDEVADKDKAGAASSLSENDDVVRIMTIHKSKGLEFPVVFVSQLQNKLNIRYKANDYIFDRELGIGLKYVDNENRIKYKTQPNNIITDKYEEEENSENLRLLYVALTRAKEKLIITGVTKSRGINAKSGKDAVLNELYHDKNIMLPYALRKMADSPLFWVLSALKRSSLDTKKVIEQKWITLSDIDTLDEIKGEEAVNAIDKMNAFDVETEGIYRDIIEERLNYVYPYSDETILPSKISITEIKRKLNSESDDTFNYYSRRKVTGMPEFMKNEKKITSAQLGTLYHTVMEHIDFKNTESEKDITALINGLEERGIITSDEKKAADIKKLVCFINSPLFKRIRESDAVFREAPFVMSMKASRFKEFENSDAEIVVHGIIDLYFVENNEIVLVDYKTDRIYKSVTELADKYRIQLELYKEALEKNTGIGVKECLIYSIDRGESVNVEF